MGQWTHLWIRDVANCSRLYRFYGFFINWPLTTAVSDQGRSCRVANDWGCSDQWGEGMQMVLSVSRGKTRVQLCVGSSVLVGVCRSGQRLIVQRDDHTLSPQKYMVKNFANVGMSSIFHCSASSSCKNKNVKLDLVIRTVQTSQIRKKIECILEQYKQCFGGKWH